jgi:hypothetical protein
LGFLGVIFSIGAHGASLDDLSADQKAWVIEGVGTSDNVRIFDFELFRAIPDFKSRADIIFLDKNVDGDQVILPSNEIEQKMILKSDISKNPHEVGTIVGHYHDQVITFGDFFEGANKLISTPVLDLAFQQFIKKYGNNKISYLEFIHTHPRFDAIQVRSGHTVMYPINSQDLTSAMVISMKLQIPVSVVAVVPNGYSYKAFVYGSKNMTFEFYK